MMQQSQNTASELFKRQIAIEQQRIQMLSEMEQIRKIMLERVEKKQFDTFKKKLHEYVKSEEFRLLQLQVADCCTHKQLKEELD